MARLRTKLLTGIAELVTNDPEVDGTPLGVRRDVAIAVEGDRIAWIGNARQAPACDDYFELADMAGSFEALPAWFARMYEQAAARYPEAGTAAEQWEEYLGGIYAVCLRAVTPADCDGYFRHCGYDALPI